LQSSVKIPLTFPTHTSFLSSLYLSRFSRGYCTTCLDCRSVVNGYSEPFIEPKLKSEQIAFRGDCRRSRGKCRSCLAANRDNLLVPPPTALARSGPASSTRKQIVTHGGGVRSPRLRPLHVNWQVLRTCSNLLGTGTLTYLVFYAGLLT